MVNRDEFGKFIKGRRFKHSEITKKKISKALKGHKGYWKDKHRSKETREKMSKTHKGGNSGSFKKGQLSSNFKGGRIKNRGYIYILKPYHPFCDSRGYIQEHRFVIEKYLRRYLKKGEVSHHINGIKDDNRPENLMAFVNHSAHRRFEKSSKYKKSEIIFDGRNYKYKRGE